MYSEEERSFALDRLYRCYKVYAQKTFEEVVRDLRLEIFENDIPLCNAYLCFGRGDFSYRVEISKKVKLPELRQYLVYHEIAELYLAALRERGGYWEKEYWCDAFASAMVLAQLGVTVITEENYQAFLTEGLPRLAKGKAPDRFEGERLLDFGQKHDLKSIKALGELLRTNKRTIAK